MSRTFEELARDQWWAATLAPAALAAIDWWQENMAERFPGWEERLVKLQEEVQELADDPASEEEAADVFIALVLYCRLRGMNLGKAVMRKVATNARRQWSQRQGTVQHEEEDNA